MPENNNFKQSFLEEEDTNTEELESFPLEEDENLASEDILAQWQIPEFHKHAKTKKWYSYFFLIIGVIIALSIIGLNITLFKISDQAFAITFDKGNYLFIIFIILATILYLIIEKADIKTLDFTITYDGIFIANKFTEFKNLKNFYIIYQPPQTKNLYLQYKNTFRPYLQIPLLDQNPVEIRKILLEFLPEDLAKEDIPTREAISGLLKL